MADRLSQYPMLSNFNNNILQQQLQQQQPSQQHQDSHSILPPSTLDQAMIWQQMQMQQQFRPHGAVEMNSHAPAQVRNPSSCFLIFPIATAVAVGAPSLPPPLSFVLLRF